MNYSLSSRVLFGIGVAMTVAAISSIFIVMVAGQNQQQQAGDGGATQQPAGNGNQTTTTAGDAGTTTITIPQGAAAQTVQQYYEPDPAEVTSGSEVTWQNQDSQPHTATADDGSFDTGNIAAGQSGSATVQGQGEISYHCTIHPFMTATLQVSGGGGAAQQQGEQPQEGNQTQQGGNQTAAQQQPPAANDTQAAGQNQTAQQQNGTTSTISILQGSSSHDAEQFYEPDPAQVQSGTQVTWQNQDSVAHTATARDGSFDTGNIAPGQSGSAMIQGQGTIDYYCTIHPHMTGTLQVVSGGQQQPSQQAGITQEQNETQVVQTDQAAVSDAVQQLQQLSPNELAQALQQLGQSYLDAATTLQGDQAQVQNETSVARDSANNTQEQQPGNMTTAGNASAADVAQSAGQNITRSAQVNGTLLEEARNSVSSIIQRLNNLTHSPQ